MPVVRSSTLAASAPDRAAACLLSSRDPSIRYLTLTEVLGESRRSRAAVAAREAIPRGARVRALLRGQSRDGGFAVNPYTKWTGAHWRLVSLSELAVPPGHPGAERAAAHVLDWLVDPGRRSMRPFSVKGKVRMHASLEGNALAACCRLGLARDPRARQLVDWLLAAKWPDGGWNCDPRAETDVSSFYETVSPMWGLHEYARATGDRDASAAAGRAAEVFLTRGLFRSRTTGGVINPLWLRFHYPLYWHYDVLHGLVMLSRLGLAADPRCAEALDLVESKRRPDGLWRAEGYYWRPLGSSGSNTEVVDWGRGGPNEMITLNALRVLRSAGRLEGAGGDV
jgi:hypothetical protein